ATCSVIVRSATQQERAYLNNKYRSTLTNEHLHQCLHLAFIHFMPKFKPQKSVTFHKNKARPHHLLCIVQTFLLELCFWILTVTVPDPGVNGNLASGPFGYLIEYLCTSLCIRSCLPLWVYVCSIRLSTPICLCSGPFVCMCAIWE